MKIHQVIELLRSKGGSQCQRPRWIDKSDAREEVFPPAEHRDAITGVSTLQPAQRRVQPAIHLESWIFANDAGTIMQRTVDGRVIRYWASDEDDLADDWVERDPTLPDPATGHPGPLEQVSAAPAPADTDPL